MPDTFGYYVAGYVVAGVVYAAYVLSLVVRARKLQIPRVARDDRDATPGAPE
jgi:hypothetical protein